MHSHHSTLSLCFRPTEKSRYYFSQKLVDSLIFLQKHPYMISVNDIERFISYLYMFQRVQVKQKAVLKYLQKEPVTKQSVLEREKKASAFTVPRSKVNSIIVKWKKSESTWSLHIAGYLDIMSKWAKTGLARRATRK